MQKKTRTANVDSYHIKDKYRDQIPSVVNEILKDIGSNKSTDKVGITMVPSEESVIKVTELIFNILFPGYFGEQEIDKKNIHFYLGEQINELYRKLSSQIVKCLIHECKDRHPSCAFCYDQGKEETIKFIKTIPKIRRLLATDVEAALEGDPAARSKEEIIFCYPGFRAISVHRVAHELFVQKIPIIPRMMSEYIHRQTGVDIHPGATIGEHFFIDHATGVVIGETTKIGKRVRIYQGVTLGALSIPSIDRTKQFKIIQRHPTIEDGVIIYANATILGGQTVIGKNAVIGGNVWITSSVKPNSKIYYKAK